MSARAALTLIDVIGNSYFLVQRCTTLLRAAIGVLPVAQVDVPGVDNLGARNNIGTFMFAHGRINMGGVEPHAVTYREWACFSCWSIHQSDACQPVFLRVSIVEDPHPMAFRMLLSMRTRLSTTVNTDWLTAARARTGLSDSALIDKALVALLDQAEREAEDRAFGPEQPLGEVTDGDVSFGWPADAPPLDTYDGEVPADVLELFAERRAQA
jgi:hypothetical protein